MKNLLLAATLLLAAAPARAWDPAGHMLIGQIAWELTDAKTRKAVDELVATLDNRFNGGRPYHFVTVSCWMDDLRSLPKNEYPWSAWHYMDSEKTDDGSGFKVPGPPHVVWAIGENLKALRDRKTPREERAKALGMLFHWIGDVHQPLHATTWNDRGGNGYLISGVHFSDLFPGQVANLHTFWDKAFRFDAREGIVAELWAGPKVSERPAAPGQGIIGEEAPLLMKRFPRESLTELAQRGGAVEWARESHILGCKRAYPPGPHPGSTGVRRLEAAFAHRTYDIACRRVVLAGYRLAETLGTIFEKRR
jgi:S1/P1 Nuclease